MRTSAPWCCSGGRSRSCASTRPITSCEPDQGSVRWQIRDGLLVARAGRGRGFLALLVTFLDNKDGRVRLLIEVEVANFYPAIAAGVSIPAYEVTQSAIHVLVTHAFLRSLARLDLAKSKVGRFARTPTGRPRRDRPRPPLSRQRSPLIRAARNPARCDSTRDCSRAGFRV